MAASYSADPGVLRPECSDVLGNERRRGASVGVGRRLDGPHVATFSFKDDRGVRHRCAGLVGEADDDLAGAPLAAALSVERKVGMIGREGGGASGSLAHS